MSPRFFSYVGTDEIIQTDRVPFSAGFFITRPNIEVGDYSYYDDPKGVEQFEKNVRRALELLQAGIPGSVGSLEA